MTIDAPASFAELPADIRCAADYARHAANIIDPVLLAHLDGGSGLDRTTAENLAAFGKIGVVPRVLRRVSGGNTNRTLAGDKRPHPIMLAPLGSQALYHPHAEIASAAAAAATQTCFIASTMSSFTLEEVADAAGPDRWFQLYFQTDRAVTLDLVRRAEAAAYRAIVVTVDTPIQLPSYRAQAAGFTPAGEMANLRNYPAPAVRQLQAGQSAILHGMMHFAPDLEDISWLAGETDLPIWIKGVMHPGDAADLVARGVTGLVVSNHGGRSLDGAPSTLSCLSAIRTAVGNSVPLLLDGGIRSGSDVFKAIACGGDAVLVGRLQAYALAVAGALGVGHMIKLLREELEACMALAGCATLGDVRSAELTLF